MPRTRCAVVGCSNSLNNTEHTEHIFYHSLPDDPEIRKKWIHFAGREEDSDFSICSVHFKSEDYEIDVISQLLDDSHKTKVLKSGAVPSLLLETSNQGDIECERKEIDHNSMDVESDYSENEHVVIKDGNYYFGMMNFENKIDNYEKNSFEFKRSGAKREKVDDSGEFKVIACELCNRKFSRKLALEHHLTRIHRLTESKVHSYLQKVMHHSAQNYKCDACKKVFYKKSKLASHLCSPAIAVICEICHQKFTSKTGLKRHLLGVHNLGQEKVDSIMEQLVDYNSRFYKKLKVEEDVVIRGSDGRVIRKDDGSEYKSTNSPRCSKCYKAFQYESASITHACEPTIEITCVGCMYKAPTKYNMKRHLTLRHKLTDIDINLIMEEFNCYNEKLQLRTLDDSNRSVKRKSSSGLIRDESHKSFEDNMFLSSDEEYIISNEEMTCERCYSTFENSFLYEDHYCEESTKPFKSSKIKTKVKVESGSRTKNLVCEICESEFSLRIALKRHLSRSHNLDADVVDVFLERISGGVDSPTFSLDLDAEVSTRGVRDGEVKLISHDIEPIDCKVCHEKLQSKKDLKGHLRKCFKMKESTLNSIFHESKDYYAKFYEKKAIRYDVALSSSDGRFLCKKKNSEFTPVPGPRCQKCNKAFIDEFKIVGHDCVNSITVTCEICNGYTASTKHKMICHMMNVHKQEKLDVLPLIGEFQSYNERLQLRQKNWPGVRPINSEKEQSSLHKESKRAPESSIVSSYIKKEKESSSSETEFSKIRWGKNSNEMQQVKNKFSEQFTEGVNGSDSDIFNWYSNIWYSDLKDANLMSERSDSNSNFERVTARKTMRKNKISGKSLRREEATKEYGEMKEILCEICKRKFCRKVSLRKHLIIVHHCSKWEADSYLKRIAHESAANFKCDVCKKRFYKKNRLISHDCNPAIAVMCELCGRTLSSKIALKRHLLFSHKLEESKVNSILDQLSDFNSKFYKKLKIEEGEIAICSSDGRNISKKSGSRFIMYMGLRCDTCYKALDEESESTHECATQIEIGCEICRYSAPSKYNLRRHLVLIHKITQDEAKMALQEFNRYSEKLDLVSHQNRTQNNRSR